ncbi:carboxyphosphonoenolpyruvate phosphonomutase-like protein [Zopfia rhizophila CBS 207.26]|uniref:Carboxyphosphonoenolpyruvate phosphonomutase-like protein n=1 Tax=Zopfia rhizophila CBS 207.26 TaxID=1314779 RepID=A0A6A6EC10_9PEZI|nr:carboxyphosphonoenolpyruvate phosphonomutase-like protein [Zopfia rhizophila CBS 207.26]
MSSTTNQNTFAHTLKSLHKPGNPLLLTNVWDAITARAVAQLPATQAIATASFAIAAAAGLEDHDLSLEVNLSAIRAIALIAKSLLKPLTVDLQDGYGDQLERGIREIIKLGAVGCNLEDFGRELGANGDLYPIEVAQERIRTVMRVANEEGVPDFVVNARTDALLNGRSMEEAIARGKAFLEAGASNVFVWGGKERGGTTRAEVVELVKAFKGQLNVILVRLLPGGLTVDELKEIGVARISIGPQLMWKTSGLVAEEAGRILAGEAA